MRKVNLLSKKRRGNTMARIASNHLKYLEFGDSIKVTVKNENGREIEVS